MWEAWLIAMLILALAEIITTDITFLMLAAGAGAGALASLFSDVTWVQVTVFAIASVIILFAVRPTIKNWLLKDEGLNQSTNVSALIGKDALVLEQVSTQGGLVKLAGEQWTARLHPTSLKYLEAGTVAVVVEISGATALVKAKRES